MIGYVTLGTDNPERAQGYYDALLATIGAKRMMTMDEEDGSFTIWGTGFDKPGIAITRPFNREPADKGNGNMVALMLENRPAVDAFHAKALELGGSDEGAPGVRGDDGPMAFYAAYFRDPDGNKLCAYKIGPDA
ncbi:VOC family protein [Alterisphingorhabdus coralli]|uniref:VOC family protein n=1 Tax=Alterisphingorhabdus coralli TaxID=3071408 RepID=A0AA97I0L3_9SPHN|nr:VOC family protein [Parasphingorhabdus sp. SCSIO 66989]WOE75799.1 VOC family protein [Parasphingorhabdus sp. SCSIO 66989]